MGAINLVSACAHFSYDEEKKVLTVQFRKVGRYEYAAVPSRIGVVLNNADTEEEQECAVALFYKTVEGKFKSTRVGN